LLPVTPHSSRVLHLTATKSIVNPMLAKPLVGGTLRTDSLPMKLHRVLNSLLILLLLCAQQAAYAHAVSHLGKEPPAKEQLAHSKLCGKCVSFEKISGVAPASVPVFVSLDLLFAQPLHVDYVFVPRSIAAFHSRAPPAYL